MDDWNSELPGEVLSCLNAMRVRSELTDVVLKVEGRSFPCHRAVLACSSPYFQSMFNSSYAEAKQGCITIKGVSAEAMATILDYAYTGDLRTEPDQVQAVMSAARLLQVDFVFRKAAKYMKDHLDISNCADVLMYADMLGELALQEASRTYMASRFHEVVCQPSFLQLSLSQLQSVLDRDDLMTLSEDDIVQAALKWVDFDQDNRLQHLSALCRSFRQSFISSKTRMELESRCPLRECKVVYSSSRLRRQGQVRSRKLIFLRDDFTDVPSPRYAPCFDTYTSRMSWMKVNSMNLPDKLSGFSIAVTPDNDLYLAGGVDNDSKGDMTVTEREKAFFKYNHLLNTWDPKAEMISPRVSCGLVHLEGFIYAIGGDETKKAAERYDPICDKWTSIPPIPYPMSTDLCAVTLDSSIYVITKEGCYRFSATENMWSKIADMTSPPEIPQAITYQGCIFCVDRNRYSTYIEMYNPNDDVWKKSGNNISFRCCSTVLVVFGDSNSLYLFTLLRDSDAKLLNLHPSLKKKRILLYKYEPEKKSWSWMESSYMCTNVANMTDFWLVRRCRTDFLVAWMIPSCLGDAKVRSEAYFDPIGDSDDEVESDDTSRSGSSYDGDSGSDSDLWNQDDSDVDNMTDEEESGSDNGDI